MAIPATRNRFRDQSSLVRYLMVRVLPVMAIILSVVGLAAVETSERRVRSELQLRLSQFADHNRDMISHRLNAIHDQARVLASNDLLINGLFDLESRSTYLNAFFQSLRIPGLDGTEIVFTDYQGRPIATNRVDLPAGPLPGPQGWRKTIETGKSIVRVDSSGLFLAVPMFFAGFPEGAIVVHLPPDHLSQIFTSEKKTGALTVFGADEEIIYDSTDALFQNDKVNPDWVTAKRQIDEFGGLKLYTGERREKAFAPVSELRKTLIAAFGLALAVMAGGIGFTALIARRQLDRLVDIIQGVRGTDDLHSRIRMDGPLEITRLGDAFNGMLATLQGTTVSRDRIDSILNSMQEVLIVCSSTGDIRITNPAADRLLKSRKLSTAVNVAVALRSDSPAVQGDLERFIRITGGDHIYEMSYPITADEEIYLRWSKSILLDRDEAPVGIIFIGQDVTERRMAERIKGEFISTVSHELRTPLTSISGSLGLLRAGAVGDLPPKALDLIKLGHDNCDRLVRLINDILDIQKMDSGGISIRQEPVDMDRLCNQTIQETTAYADSFKIALRYENWISDRSKAWTMADFDRLQQVLTNLISNAVKFSPDETEVVIRLDHQDHEILLSVIDEGPGIPENFRGRIFQRFAQADSSDTRGKGGTGLGLAIVKSITDRLGGRVWFDCPGYGGTEFHVALRVYEGDTADQVAERTVEQTKAAVG